MVWGAPDPGPRRDLSRPFGTYLLCALVPTLKRLAIIGIPPG